MRRGGGNDDGGDDGGCMATNYINIKIHKICLFFCNSLCATEVVRRHTNPLNIDLIFIDVMCCDVGRMAQACIRAMLHETLIFVRRPT